MKRTTLFATLVVTAVLLGLMWAVLPTSAEPPQTPTVWLALPPLSPDQPIGVPEGICAANAIPTYTLTFTATQDAYVNQQFPSTNYGTADLLVGTLSGNIRRSLLQFDLAALPSNAVVVSATLELYQIVNLANKPEATQVITPQFEAILAAWSESTVNWNNQPLAESRGDPAYTVFGPGYNKFDVTHIAQAWKSGAVINNGLRMRNDADTTYLAFESRHNTHKPRLTIVYHTCAKPLTGVSVSGPTLGVTNTGYTFNSQLSPLDATTPITYRWTATNYTCGAKPNPACPTGSSGTFTWTVLGAQTVTLTTKNCSGETFTTTHTITISKPAASCTFPLTSLTLNGPTTGITGTNYVYTASTSKATYPITYTWQATNQAPRMTVISATKHLTSFNWLTVGTKLITVTAQNCGGAATANRAVSIVDPAQLPDLVITNAWYESDQDRVGYLIRNIGGGTAYAPHTTEMQQNGAAVAQGVFEENLAPGAIRAGYINQVWSCTGSPTAVVRLSADDMQDVGEQNEANNVWQDTWSCDLTLPRFVAGPSVVATTETTASITWTTNETTTGQIRYDTRNGMYGLAKSDPANSPNHQTTLTGLLPGQTYQYTVIATDTAGLVINSPSQFFETQPIGTDPPQIKSIDLLDYPSEAYEFYILRAVLTQTQGIDRVSFFLDGQLIGRDQTPQGNVYEVYLSPAARGLSRADWFKSHTLQVQAYNLEGEVTAQVKNVTPVSKPLQLNVSLTNLKPGTTVLVPPGSSSAPAGTTLTVTMHAYQYEWRCTGESTQPTPPGIEPVTCLAALRRSVTRMSLLWDGATVSGSIFMPPAGVFTHTYQVNLTGKSVTAHTLEAYALATDGTPATRQRTITIEPGTSSVDVTRQVTRVGNYYRIVLILKNIGNMDAHVDKLEDTLMGFQAVRKAFGPTYTVNTIYNHALRESIVTLDLKNGTQTSYTLAPGAQVTIEYVAVPILYESDVDYSIGYESGTQVYYTIGSGTYLVRMPFYEPVVIWSQISDALETSNYLIMTNPQELFAHTAHIDWGTFTNPTDRVQEVLSSMAYLAYLKNGVLGYLDTTQSGVIDSLLESGGDWADALHPDFRETDARGYVLFVGENEIIPTQAGGYGVDASDLRYASTSGQAKPELVLGRIVGNDAPSLNQALQAAIRTYEGQTNFNRSQAILYSGRGEGNSTFWSDVKGYASQLDSEFTVTKLHGTDYTEDNFYDTFQPLVANQDVILYRGHGNPTSWFGLGPSNVPGLVMTPTSPFVFSLACTAGAYEGDGEYGLTDAFMRYGAANYIGSVKVSSRPYNSWAGTAFFNRWNSSATIGYAFTDLKRDKWAEDDSGWREWIYEYQLYGDPKYGAVSTQANAALSADGPLAPAATLDVHVPDYQLTLNEEGQQLVNIPGGLMLLEAGQYQIPYWSVGQTYPKGQQIQAVTMTTRSGLLATTGLNIPTVTTAIDCMTCGANQVADDSGWYPELDKQYRWTTEQNPDGSVTLVVVVYPMYYNAQTTDVLFYQDYTFDVLTTTTGIEITSLLTDQPVYHKGDKVMIDLTANNSGALQDFIVAASVKTLSDELTAGLPLRSLHALTGTAATNLEWDTTGFAAGSYYVEVELQDDEGNLLDREVREFTLGVAAGEVTALKATPALFKIGNSVAVTLTFQNTGDVPITGTAYIQIAHANGLTFTQVFTHPVTNLAAGQTFNVADVWPTTGMPTGDYTALGYVSDALQVLDSKAAALSTTAKVYLPLILR
jgi:hypothetical protein